MSVLNQFVLQCGEVCSSLDLSIELECQVKFWFTFIETPPTGWPRWRSVVQRRLIAHILLSLDVVNLFCPLSGKTALRYGCLDTRSALLLVNWSKMVGWHSRSCRLSSQHELFPDELELEDGTERVV